MKRFPIARSASVASAFVLLALVAGCQHGFDAAEQSWPGRLVFGYGADAAPQYTHIAADGSTSVHAANPYHGKWLSFGEPRGVKPAGASVQAMRFGFRSEGYFSHNPAGHLAIILHGEWALDDPATPDNEADLRGRGLVIGAMSGRPDGCREAPAIQVETYWNSRLLDPPTAATNALYPQTCSPMLDEDTWYLITLRVADGGRVAYTLADADGRVLYRAQVRDTINTYVPDTLGGFGFGTAFDTDFSARWNFQLRDLDVWWERDWPAAEGHDHEEPNQ